MSIWGSIITAYERFVFPRILNIIGIVLNLVVMICLLYMGYKALALVVVQTIFNVLTLILNYIYCKKELSIKMYFRNFLDSKCDGEYIQWLGHRKDVLELLKSSHIMTFPSWYREGLPKSVIETEAIGRPIVTTDSVGCRDTVIDGVNGYLIPPKNANALADALKKLIDNQSLRKDMGEKAREFAVQKFDIKDVIKVHLDIYKQI